MAFDTAQESVELWPWVIDAGDALKLVTVGAGGGGGGGGGSAGASPIAQPARHARSGLSGPKSGQNVLAVPMNGKR